MSDDKNPYSKDILDSSKRVYPIGIALLNVSSNVIFFGSSLRHECQKCGAYEQTSKGHNYCTYNICPIGIREFKRRRKRQMGSLENTYYSKNDLSGP